MRQRPIVLPLIAWLAAVALIIAGALWLASCATELLPACAPYQYRIAEGADGEQFRVLDAEDVAKLNALILGLAHGTCRLPTTPPPRRSEQPPEPTRKWLDT